MITIAQRLKKVAEDIKSTQELEDLIKEFDTYHDKAVEAYKQGDKSKYKLYLDKANKVTEKLQERDQAIKKDLEENKNIVWVKKAEFGIPEYNDPIYSGFIFLLPLPI